jgi:PAS domain S-box-containing protein
MNLAENKLHQQLQSACARVQDLHKRATSSPIQQPLLEEALKELSILLEELNVSFEEIRQSNYELGAAQEETAAQHRRYRELFDFTPTGYLVTDTWGNIQDANRMAQEMLGFGQDSVVHKPLTIFVSEKDQGRFRELLTRLVTEEVTGEWETELSRRHENVSVPASLSAFRLCDQQGKTVRLLWLVRDITERKKAEELVQKSLRRVSALRDINNAIMSTLDLQEVLDFLLERIEQFFPYPIATTVRLFNQDKELEYLLCRNIRQEDWQKGEPGRPGARAEEAIRTQAPVVIRNIQTDSPPVRRPDFYRRNNLVSYMAVPLITKGEILGLLCVYTKEEHVFDREEIAFLSSVVSQAALAIHNSRLYEQVKEQSAELQKARDDLEQRVDERTAALAKANDDLRTEIAERRRVENALRESEEKFRNLAKQLEGQLIISDRLISVGEMAASFAHEFNNPLAIILGLSQEMRSLLNPSDPHYESITNIEEEALRCRKIVLDLLDFVRPSDATFIPVDVGELLEKTRSVLSVQYQKTNVVTAIDLEPNLPPILADPQQLRQVLINLAFNAAEAMPKGGKLKFRATTDFLESAKDRQERGRRNRELTIAVSDTGIGIEPDNLSDIFRPFFTTKKSKGMGLGLSICERIMKAHRGRISAESTPGKGTTFYLHLPIMEGKD